jgi:hypothetical protein
MSGKQQVSTLESAKMSGNGDQAAFFFPGPFFGSSLPLARILSGFWAGLGNIGSASRVCWNIGFLHQHLAEKSGFDNKLRVKMPTPTYLGRPDQVSLSDIFVKKAPWRMVFFKADRNQPGISGSCREKSCWSVGPTGCIWTHMIKNDILPSF